MVLLDVTFALVIAVVVAAIFTWGLGRPGPWGSFVLFVVLLFLATWAIGSWVEPIGPSFWGVAWVPWVLGALLVGLLVAAVPAGRQARPNSSSPEDKEAMAAVAVSGLFWVLILLLMLAVGAAYL